MKKFLKSMISLIALVIFAIVGCGVAIWQGWYGPFLRKVQNVAVLLEVEYEGQLYKRINVVSCRNREIINPTHNWQPLPDFLYVNVGEKKYVIVEAKHFCYGPQGKEEFHVSEVSVDNWPDLPPPLEIQRLAFADFASKPMYVDTFLRSSSLKDKVSSIKNVRAEMVFLSGGMKQLLGKEPHWISKYGAGEPGNRNPFELNCFYEIITLDGFPNPPLRSPRVDVGGSFYELGNYSKNPRFISRIYGPQGLTASSFSRNEKQRKSDGMKRDIVQNLQSLHLNEDGALQFDKNVHRSVRRSYRIKDAKTISKFIVIDGARIDFDTNVPSWSVGEKMYWSEEKQKVLLARSKCAKH